jgi:hypothetical protein
MQSLQQRLRALGFNSLAEWFQRHPNKQFRLMMSAGTAACFCPAGGGRVTLEMAPAYLDEKGFPRRESYLSEGQRWETVLVFYEKETYRKIFLQGTRLLTPEDMETAFTEAERAYKAEKHKSFRPGYIFDRVEFWKPKKF